MEGVGARLGRSSSRYGNTTVFTGPVRKWKKDWVPITPPSSSSLSNNSNNHNHNQNQNQNQNHNNLQSSSNGSSSNGSSSSLNGNTNVSHLRLYKWTPLSNRDNSKGSPINQNNGNTTDNDSPTKENSKEEDVLEPPKKKKFKYIPIAVLEEQKKEAETEEVSGDEANPTDANENKTEQNSKSDDHSEKPDINDIPMEENEDTEEKQTGLVRQDLNETLDLN